MTKSLEPHYVSSISIPPLHKDPFMTTHEDAIVPSSHTTDITPLVSSTSVISPFVIGICGGVGPAAGVYLHNEIIENTALPSGIDQEHLEVIHASRSCDLPDRTKFLLGEVSVNPADGMIRTLGAMRASTEYLGQRLVAAVPCGTFHSPPIFDRFTSELKRLYPDVTLVSMIEEVIIHLKERAPHAKVIGVMSTTGTRKARLYNHALEPLGYSVVQVDDDMQLELYETIYNPSYGLKSVVPASTRAKRNFEHYVKILKTMGAQAVILGCTEIPLALPKHSYRGLPLIDPLTALARGLIRNVDKKRLSPIRSPDPGYFEAGLVLDHGVGGGDIVHSL